MKNKINTALNIIVIALTITLLGMIITKSYATDNFLLDVKNTISLRGDVDEKSVDKLIKEMLDLSFKLPADAEINLVINSGGGSVFDGMRLINVMNVIPQKINTIAIFAFSMAYSIFQRGTNRYITELGVIGQHRAKVTLSGQINDGELESRLNWLRGMISIVSTYEAEKMDLSLEEYKSLIKDEMWLNSNNSIKMKAADRVTNIKCSKALYFKREIFKSWTIIGEKRFYKSACPLIDIVTELK